ncbi:MAG: iron ABC transporter [Rhodospirillales bacterium]|nr:MAG: iron ABC transporter [Rhodospirillales bacterium]
MRCCCWGSGPASARRCTRWRAACIRTWSCRRRRCGQAASPGMMNAPTASPISAFAAAAARRQRHVRSAGLALVMLWTGVFVLAVGWGAVAIGPVEIAVILAHRLGIDLGVAFSARDELILLNIRLPRAVLGALVGATLAVSGAALQGLFRNPLADPGLIGVSTGAALAAALTIVLGGGTGWLLTVIPLNYLLPVAAFAGALVATLLVYRIASRDGRTDVATMLLAGIAINAIAGAAIGLMVFISDDQQLRDLNFWMLGSLGGAGWQTMLPALPLLLLPLLALLLLSGPLNALLLGEQEAVHLGYDVERAKTLIVLLVAAGTGAAVALTGVIGFVGLVVPHLIRLMLGPDHRALLPLSAVLGGVLLLAADMLARTVVLPAELPIGILTSCVGGPFFLWLLMRRRVVQLW